MRDVRRWAQQRQALGAAAIAGCAMAVIAACAGTLGGSQHQRAVLAAAPCSSFDIRNDVAGCAEVQQDAARARAGQQRVRRGRQTPDAMPDPGLLGRAGLDAANTFGSLAAVGTMAEQLREIKAEKAELDKYMPKAKTPSLVSFNIGHAFEGSGAGPKWENSRTAVFGHHAGDPKVMVSATDVEQRGEPPYYYNQDHGVNGKLLNGENQDAPAWWPKGRDHNARPLVTWGARYVGEPYENEHKDDRALVRAGVNVEGERNIIKGLPLPWYDSTQWDHDLQQAVDPPKSPDAFRLRDAQSSATLTKAGVAVSRDPFASEKEQGHSDKVVIRSPCTYRYVDGVAGMQTHTPYFLNPNALRSQTASKFKLEKAGVLLSSNLFDKALPSPAVASYDPTRDDGCDQGDSEMVVDFGKTHRLPEGQLDVEMEPPHGTTHFVNVFSPAYHGPGAKTLTTQGDLQFD
jgi:hypothetical protein